MSKIKRIEISDFRIYEGKEEFSFQGDKGTSNLVALYAPNGFGKTSFFDAVEWGFSDKIERFENRLINKSIKDEKENTILLTNSTSYEKDLRGKVNIVMDNKNSFIEKTVKTHRKPKTNYYNDYLKGRLSNGSIKNDLTKFPTTNILTQDQIDAFLRFKTPEQKFEDLKEFWPESEEATNRLRQLRELHKNILKRIDSIKSKLDEHKHNLEGLERESKNIAKINLWLEIIKGQEVYECNISIEKIDNSIAQEIYDTIYDENARNIKEVDLELGRVQLIYDELNKLETKFRDFVSNKEKSTVLIKKLTQIQNRKSQFLNQKKSKELEKSIRVEVLEIKQRIEKYKFIDSHVLDYISNVGKIENYKIENEHSINNNTKILDHIQIIKESIYNLGQLESQCKQSRLDKEKQQSDVDRQYDEHETTNKKLKARKKVLPELALKISEKNIAIEKLQKIIQVFDKALREEVFPNTILIENRDYIELSNELAENTELVKTINDEVTLKQKVLDKSGSLNENLNRIILFGEDYITKTNTSDCPLCKTTFRTFEDLIASVKHDKKDTLRLGEQRGEIAKLNDDILELQKFRVVLTTQLKRIVSFSLEEASKGASILQEEKNKIVNEVNDVQNIIKNLEFELSSCTNFFKEFFQETNSITKENVNALKKSISEDIDKFKIRESRIKKIIEEKTAFLLKKESESITNQSTLEKNKNSIESIQNQSVHQKIRKDLNELNLNDSQVEKVFIQGRLKEDEKELSQKTTNLNSISEELRSIEKSLVVDDFQIDELNLEGDISKTKNLLQTHGEQVDKYLTKFNKYITSEEVTESVIKANQLKNQEILNGLSKLSKDLYAFGIDLELIKENVSRNELGIKIKKLKSHLPGLLNASDKIDAAKKDCMSYVETGINNYFNKEVINEIYSRIEPHPKLTKIDFKTDFNDRGEPRLLIRTGNSKEEVNPVLFLSAGQVNVLSLSIFLAKAFEYGNKTIETIFMDDPIQNLSDINVLSFIDLLRTLISTHDKQIVISTHDEKFFRLLQNKLPEEYCNTKYFEFESEGKLKK